MLSPYLGVLRLERAWRFSAAGLVLRLPMSMVGISIILLVRAQYGSYALAGAVSAVNIIATACCAPALARLVDRRGQSRVMGPSWAVSSAAMAALLACAAVRAPEWLLFVSGAVAGATWGAPGALVRSRWAAVLDRADQLTTAYAYESAMDELVYILGPVLSTVLGTLVHPGAGVLLSVVFLAVGGALFLSGRDSEPEPTGGREHGGRGSVIRMPTVAVMALTYIGMGTMLGANDVAVVAFAAERGVPAMSGVLLAVSSAASLLAGLVYGARSWRWPTWRLYKVCVVAIALGATAYLAAYGLWTMALVMSVTGMAYAPTMTNVNMIVQKTVPPHRLTEGLTWMSTSLNMGASLGSALAGPAVDAGGSYGGYLVTVGSAWAMVLLMAAGVRALGKATAED